MKFKVIELFTDKEIKDFDIVEIEEDIDLKNFTIEKIYDRFKKEQFIFAMFFVDKYGNTGIKYIGNYKSLKQHLRFHNNLLKGGTLSLKNIDDRFTFVKHCFNNKIIYGIN